MFLVDSFAAGGQNIRREWGISCRVVVTKDPCGFSVSVITEPLSPTANAGSPALRPFTVWMARPAGNIPSVIHTLIELQKNAQHSPVGRRVIAMHSVSLFYSIYSVLRESSVPESFSLNILLRAMQLGG